MKLILLLILSLLLSISSQSQPSSLEKDQNLLISLSYKWSFFENFAIFTFLPINDQIEDEDSGTYLAESGVTNKKIYFSFCNDSNIDCSNISKNDNQRGAAILRDEDTKDCVLLSTPDWNQAEITYVNNKLDRSRDYLRLSWEGQEPCPVDETKNLGFSIDVICTDATDPKDVRYYYSGGYSDGTCQIRTVFESKLGCAIVSYREVFEFLSKNYYIFGTILIVLGILLLLFGFRLLLVSLFLGGVVTTVLVAAVIAFQFIITKNTEQYVLWIILGIALVLGCIIGYALVKFQKGGIFILAAIAGLCLALILNSAVFRYAQSKALFWVVIGAWSLGCGIISCFVGVILSIGVTSLIGAYSLVRGISVFVGHFPDEVSLIEQLKNGIAPKTDYYFWGYLAGIIVIFVIGFFIQWRFRPKTKKKSKNGRRYQGLLEE